MQQSRSVLTAISLFLSLSGCAVLNTMLEPTDAEKQRAAADEAGAAACASSGIELMGLYKNEVFDRQMGGGIVEWLAKIRNNTGVTRIVEFTWVNASGQLKRAQVQIAGGAIASPSLDLTQSTVISPVKNLRLVSCQ
jgi:hypothetical protein